LCAALALKQREGTLTVVNSVALAEPKTKRMVEFLGRLQVGTSVLIVISETDANVEKSARNLPGVKVLHIAGLNVYDLLRYRQVIFAQDALRQVNERLAS
jgi:large subunit ribosomal protein L4